jgi:hypothetical protein
MKVEYDLQWSANDWKIGGSDNFVDDNHVCKVFFGYKFAGEIIQRLWIYCNGKETGYEQSEEGRQCFCMKHSLDANTVKGQKNTSTAWNDVQNYSDIVCGLYINQDELVKGAVITVKMNLVIPLYMLAEFQALDFYPSFTLGQLELQMYIQSRYAVWAVLDPRKVCDVKSFFEDAPVAIDWETVNTNGLPISRKFAQIGNPLNVITRFLVSPSGSHPVDIDFGARRLSCVRCKCSEMIANISGFNCTQATLSALRELYTTPWRIPAEYLEYFAFPHAPDANGLQSSTQINAHNVKDIYVMFPQRANDYTVFENPMIDNFYIKILGQQYPERVYDTLSQRFYQNMIMACDLDAGLRPTKDFIDAYTMRKNVENDGRRFNNTLRDNTNFALVIQTERNQSGYVFDGIHSYGQSTPLEIHFNPLFPGENDTYFNCDPNEPNLHPPPPQIWLCCDAYWEADPTNGLRWFKGDRNLPEDLDTDEM